MSLIDNISLPEEWEIVKIEDIFNIQQGKQLSAKENQQGKTKRPFLRTSNIFWGNIDLSKIDYMFFTDDEIKKLSLEEDDILVCEGGDIGRCAIWNNQIKEVAYQNHLHRLRNKRNNIVNHYFVFWMEYAIKQRQLYISDGNRTTIPNLSASRLKKFLFPLPPLAEQMNIASILSAVQEAREKTEAVIDAARALKKSMMKHLFTYGPVAPQDAPYITLKETEIGSIPEEWEIVNSSDVFNKITGGEQESSIGCFVQKPAGKPDDRQNTSQSAQPKGEAIMGRFADEKTTVQQTMIEYTKRLGWQYLPPSETTEMRGGRNGVFLNDTLHSQLLRLNPGFMTGDMAGRIISDLLKLPANAAGNQTAWEYLAGGKTIYVPAAKRELNITLIDKNNTLNNTFHVSDEYAFANLDESIRQDIAFFINGLPLVFVETKSAAKTGGITDAFNQVVGYHKKCPQLLVHQQIYTLAQIDKFLYGVTWNTSTKNLLNWKTETPGDIGD